MRARLGCRRRVRMSTREPRSASGRHGSDDVPHDLPMTLSTTGPWQLPLEGFEVLQLTFAYPIDIVAYGDGGASTLIRFEGRFDFTEPHDGVHHLNAAEQPWSELGALFSLRGDRITSAKATEGAQLRVEFASGRLIEAGPDPAYENWEVSGPGFQLIATPGGGVAVFDQPGHTRRFRAK